ncbi:MAG: hypothetical protein AAGA32_17545 [Pseudomonadota bacterium]
MRSTPGTIDWLCERYIRAADYRNLAPVGRKILAGEIDWLREQAGDLPFRGMRTKDVEALMAKKSGPASANKVKKLLSRLCNFAIRNEEMSFNPARLARKYKENPDGYYTATPAEIDVYRRRHRSGTMARLALELALNTGMARQDMVRASWVQFDGGRFTYRRVKTDEHATLPVLPDL